MKYLSTIIPIGLTLVLLMGIYGLIVGFQTSAITLRENARESWGNVESSYQRRNDLIGNLVNTVKGAANYEKSTLTTIIEARAKATSTSIDISKATPSQIKEFQSNQGAVSSSLSRLLVSVEKYPELRANENFLRLQNELAGTENRIKFDRNKYNATINPYNVHIGTFPNSIINAMFFHFVEMPYYKADLGSEKAPKVEFN